MEKNNLSTNLLIFVVLGLSYMFYSIMVDYIIIPYNDFINIKNILLNTILLQQRLHVSKEIWVFIGTVVSALIVNLGGHINLKLMVNRLKKDFEENIETQSERDVSQDKQIEQLEGLMNIWNKKFTDAFKEKVDELRISFEKEQEAIKRDRDILFRERTALLDDKKENYDFLVKKTDELTALSEKMINSAGRLESRALKNMARMEEQLAEINKKIEELENDISKPTKQ